MLKDSLKFLFKDTAIYGLSNAFSKFFQFLTIPLIVKFLSVQEFGVWTLLFVYGNIFSSILIFGMDSAVVRFFYDNPTDAQKKKLFSTGLLFQIILFLLSAVIFFIIPATSRTTLLGLSDNYHIELLIVFFWTPAFVVTHYCQNWFKWTFQRTRFLISSIGFTLANFLVLLLLLNSEGNNLLFICQITLCTQFAIALLDLFWCKEVIQWTFDKKLLTDLVKFGFPMMMVFLFGVLSSSLDRLFLVKLMDSVQFGIYTFSQKLGGIMNMFVLAFQIAFGPFLYSIWEKAESKRVFSKFQTYYIMVFCAIAIPVSAFGKVLVDLMGSSEYQGAEKVLPLLFIGAILNGLYSFASIGISYSKKSYLIFWTISIGLIVNFFTNIVLAPYFYQYGVAIGWIIGNLSMITTAYLISRKYYTIKFNFIKDIVIFICFIGALLVLSYFSFSTNAVLDGLINSFAGLFLFSTAALLLLTKEEKEFLKNFLSRYSSKAK